jgi:Kef-type K+ transport system membrane component KefB
LLIYAGRLAVFFPLFVAVAMSVSGFIGFAVSIVFPFVLFTLVLPTILPTLFIVLIAVKTAFILIMMVLSYCFFMAVLSHSGNCSETTDCHNERERS